jgi:hypothetical protein
MKRSEDNSEAFYRGTRTTPYRPSKSHWIVSPLPGLCRHYPDYVAVTWIMSPLPGLCLHYLDCVATTWIVFPLPGLCFHYLDCVSTTWIVFPLPGLCCHCLDCVATIPGLCRHYLDCVAATWIGVRVTALLEPLRDRLASDSPSVSSCVAALAPHTCNTGPIIL